MSEYDAWMYVIAFVLAACYNVLWTQYSLATTRRQAWAGALWAALISLITSIQVYLYMQSLWVLVPQVTGAAVGAYFGIYEPRSLKNEQS